MDRYNLFYKTWQTLSEFLSAIQDDLMRGLFSDCKSTWPHKRTLFICNMLFISYATQILVCTSTHVAILSFHQKTYHFTIKLKTLPNFSRATSDIALHYTLLMNILNALVVSLVVSLTGNQI